ncbi:MAG: LacI family DNA-binding transcriptional regulator [Prolixibacteraceae bacterium]|nr:LacI family DNA-binding transcriptional regulator [Prolixibacteraceae bacterium]
MSREVTIYDIAKELNLSASTVSRALKDNPAINNETKKRVRSCAEKMGYRSNTFASNLRTQRTNTIGVIVPRLDSNFMSACLAGMEEVVNDKGYNMIITQSHESLAKEAQNAITMFNNRVDGVIASLTIEDNNIDHFSRFKDKNVPVVFFDRVPEKTNNACFVIENHKAAYTATKHLIEQGCKNILHLTLKTKSNVYLDRIEGFKTAINEANCSGDIVYLESLNLEFGEKIIPQILKRKEQPDGIFVANDMAAVGCLLALQKEGINVPNDIAIVGFNNDPVSTIVHPQLTTISYSGKDAGILAAKSLIDYLNNESEEGSSKKVVLNTQLIERASSKRK